MDQLKSSRLTKYLPDEEITSLRDGFYNELQLLYFLRNFIISKEHTSEELNKIDKIIDRVKWYLFDLMSEVGSRLQITTDVFTEIAEIMAREEQFINNK